MKYTFFMLCVFVQLNSYAQIQLSGHIINKINQSPIVGALVYFHDLKTGTASDANGYFKISNLPKGRFLLTVSLIDFKSANLYINLKQDTQCIFTLEESIAEYHEVVISGSSVATDIRRNPLSFATIDKQQLNQSINTNIIDGIAKLPGISSISTGPNISKPVIRGLGYNRILTLYNGVRQEGQQWGDEHGIEIDEFAIEKVEIIKGPASLIYGSDAMGGVINLMTTKPAPNGVVRGDLLTNYQSNNQLIANSLFIEGTKNSFSWGARFSNKQATNYQNQIDGRVYGTSFNETDLSAFIGINRKWGYSQLHMAYYSNLQSVPDGSRDSLTGKFTQQISESDSNRTIVNSQQLSSYTIPIIHQEINHTRIYWNTKLILRNGSLATNFGYQLSSRKEFSHPEYANTPGLSIGLGTFTYDVKWNTVLPKNVDLTIGINGMDQINKDAGTEFIIPNYTQFDIGPFMLLRKSFEKIEWSGGLRYDLRHIQFSDIYVETDPFTGFQSIVDKSSTSILAFNAFNKSFTGLTGSVGFSYFLNERTSFKANIGRGFRSPNISEIASNGVHPGTNIYQIGNNQFKPEFSLQEDIGLFYASKHINGSIELFNNAISNYIFNQKIKSVNNGDSIDTEGNSFYQYNQLSAHLFGGELTFDIHPHPLDWLHFENSASLVLGQLNNQTNDSSKYLPLIPPFHTHSEIRIDLKRKDKTFAYSYLNIAMDYFASQNYVMLQNNTETPTKGYFLFNIGTGTVLHKSNSKQLLTIQLLCSNVFDINYQSHMSRLKYMTAETAVTKSNTGIFAMGRNVSIKMIIPF